MSALSKLEWLALAVALLLCPGFSWSQSASGASAPTASLFDRLDAAGSSTARPPKPE